MEQATEEMEEFTARLEEINADNMPDLLDKYSTYISALEALDKNAPDEAKKAEFHVGASASLSRCGYCFAMVRDVGDKLEACHYVFLYYFWSW